MSLFLTDYMVATTDAGDALPGAIRQRLPLALRWVAVLTSLRPGLHLDWRGLGA